MTSTRIDPVYRMERQRLLSNCVCMRSLTKRDAYWLDCLKASQRKLAAFRAAWSGHTAARDINVNKYVYAAKPNVNANVYAA